MRTWENLFMNHILERGRIYYKSGAVTDISKTDGDCKRILIRQA